MSFPKEAEAVRKYIRDNVARPKELPETKGSTHLRFTIDERRVCPLGLLPLAERRTPIDKMEIGLSHHSPILRNRSIEAFWEWWDSQTDPQYAVDQVWGK